MSTTSLNMMAQQFISVGPSLLVCLVACVLVGLEWRRGGKASLWAMLGFGLSALLMVIGPVVYTALTLSLQTGGPGTMGMNLQAIYSIMALVIGMLQAVAYGCLLMAVLAGRAPRQPGT